MRPVVAVRSQYGYCVSVHTARDRGRIDCPQLYKPSTIIGPAGAAQIIDVNVAALGYGDGDSVPDLAIADSAMLQTLCFKSDMRPTRVIGPVWNSEPH